MSATPEPFGTVLPHVLHELSIAECVTIQIGQLHGVSRAIHRQFLPKGTDLSVHSQEQLDETAYLMNIARENASTGSARLRS